MIGALRIVFRGDLSRFIQVNLATGDALFAWVLGDESSSWLLLLGIALTLVSMAVLQRGTTRHASEFETL